MLKKCFCLLFINFLISSVLSTPCMPRDYGRGSIVCVCNITYCDKFEPFESIPGFIIRFESGKSGKRFEKSILYFESLNDYFLNEANAKTIVISENVTYQKIIGFGGAFSDSTGINIFNLPSSLGSQIIDDYFSDIGLEYTMARVPIGGTDFSTRKYTYNDGPEDLQLLNFKLQEEDIKYKIPFMKHARDFNNKIKFFGSPWSSPAWMKTNNNLTGRGTLKGNPGGPYFKAWANYFIKFLDAYRDNGIEMWGLTTQNEPLAGLALFYPWNCLGFTPELMRDFIKLDLGPALHQSGYEHIKLMTLDDNRNFLPEWTNTILKDEQAAKYVSGFGLHWYWNDFTSTDILDQANQDYPDYFLLETEACEGSGSIGEKVSLGNWTRAENYAIDIINNLQHHVTGWVDWNMVLDEQGGPSWISNFVDSPLIVNATGQEYYKQPMYYILGHFTKFLSPDSIRIHTVQDQSQKVRSVVFKTPKEDTVLIILNMENHDVPITIKHLKNNRILNTKISSKSIQTYIWNDY